MPSDCAISPSAVSNTVAGSNSLPSPVKSPFGSVVGRPVALPPSLEAIKSQMDALIQGYSSALSPIRERPLLVSSLEESSKAVKALAFIREHIYAIASALAVIVSTIGLILCPLLSPLFITSFVLAVTGTVLGVDLSLGGRYIFKNYGANKEAETRHTLLLHLRNLEAITPDQLWQLRRAKADKSAFIQGLAGVAGEMVNKGLMSESQKVECYKKLSIPLWSNCDQVLRYMAFLTAFHASGQKVREEYLSLHNYLDAHQETKKIVAETVKTMLPEGLFERWLEPLLNLQKIAAGSPMRPQLKEFKVRFLDWLYEQILGHGITSKEAHDYESRFDELLFEALGKASPEDLEEHSVRPLVTPLVAPSDERPLKKALVIISSGGGGHISIAEATRKALEADLQYRW
ncbi:MAG: hypothetical protein WCN87_04955, partial [Chlamydiota bacterium]